MEFLFRSPLIQFEINDPEELAKNWELILEAISLSSEALYNAIKDKTPDRLTSKELSSVHRYLLRGKYRATPFGRWAGVGIANWKGVVISNQQSVNETKQIEPDPNPVKQPASYWQNPSLEQWGGGWKFWNFDGEKEIWRFSKSGGSPLIQRIQELSLESRPVDPESLFQPFPEMGFQDKKEAWNYLVESQLIVSDVLPEQQQTERREDRFILSKLSIPEKYRQSLDTFLNEISETLLDQNRPYLENLKDRFAELFDDRFVPLRLLWKLVPYLTGRQEITGKDDSELSIFPSVIDSKIDSLDLKSLISGKQKVKKPFHAQTLFRILDSGKILIDNLTFNRPLVYGGRFTFHPEISNYFCKQNTTDPTVLLADVLLYERRKLQTITRHRNLVQFQINCFSGSSCSDELDSSQIYIGLNGNRFELFVPHLGKKIEPVFQHPLNPQFISHPLCRVLWEIAHQDIMRPIHYAHPSFINADYLPELRWGDIIVQPRKWTFGKEIKCKNDHELLSMIDRKGIPQLVLLGNHDQELALELSNHSDRQLFLEELAKEKTLNVFEWLWKTEEKSTFSPICYPQFLWGKPLEGPSKKEKQDQYLINMVDGQENRSWIYVKIILRPDYQQHLVITLLTGIISEFEDLGIHPFYFLFYKTTHPEIRLRVKIKDTTEPAKISSRVFNYFNIYPEVEQIKLHPYYPEISKYSRIGMEVSETLFFQESKLIMNENPVSMEIKLSFAVGIGTLLIGNSPYLDYWILQFSNQTKGLTFRSSPDRYLTLFDKSVSKKWKAYYCAQLSQHPWYTNEEMQGRLLGNHLHMVINRLFWEDAAEYEPQVYSILSAILRRKKFGKNSKKPSSKHFPTN